MLRYFRINDPYRLLGLLVILILIYIPVFIYGPGLTLPELKSILIGEKIREGAVPFSSLSDATGPLSSWFFGFVDLIFGRSLTARHILSLLILFSQSTYFGMTLISKKAFSENTYIPSFLFSVLTFFSFDTLALSSELIGSGFLLLSLNNLFKEIEFRSQRDETIFNLGLYLSLASLCNFSFIINLVGVFAILGFYTRTSLRGYLLLLFGFSLPHLLFMSIYYINGSLSDLMQHYYLPNLSFDAHGFMSSHSLLVLGGVPLLFLLVSLVMLNREARFTKYQSQLVQSIFFWMLFSFFQVLYSKEIRPQSFITLIPGISFFITHFLLLIRRKRFAEMGSWLFLLGIVSISYLAFNKKITSVDYQNLLVRKNESGISNKRVLLLGDDINAFQSNKLATKYLDWNLSRDVFEHPEYYESVIDVNETLSADLPEIIIDKNNLMRKFFERIPTLKKKYKLTSPGVYTIIQK